MSNAGEVGAGGCPGCGAPSDQGVSAPSGAVRCAYCGTLLRRPRPTPSVFVAPRAATPPARRMVFAYAAVAAAVVILAAVMNVRSARVSRVTQALSRIPAMPGTTSTSRVDDVLALVSHPPAADDVLVGMDRASGHGLALFDGARHALRWNAGAFSHYLRRDDVAVDPTRVFVVDNPRLTALSLKDGVELWQAALLTELSCAGCLRVVKDRVVVLQKDGTIQAFDAATGRVVWSQRLERYPRRLFVAGGDLILEHITTGRHERADIDVVDPTDGTTLRTMQPSCLNSAFHRPEHPNDGTPLLLDRDGKTMFTVFGFFSHCAQAWDVKTGQRRWTTYVPKWNTTGATVLGDRALMFQNDDRGITALDVASGKSRRLTGDSEHAFFPLYGRGDEVVIAAAPTWDSSRVALWGLDAVTGQQRWQFPLSAEHLSLERVILDSWSWRRTDAGLVVLQRLPNDQVSIDVLDPATGVSAGRKLFPSRGMRSMLGDQLVWISNGGGFDAVKVPGGALAYHLP